MGKIGGPVCRKRAAQDLLELSRFFWKFLAIGVECAAPLVFELLPFRDRLAKIIDGVLRKIELVHGGPTQRLLRRGEFFFTQRAAVRREVVLLMRAAVADMRADQNQRRPALLGL